ncbi:MAG: O-antigen ligase family protein [Sumerlaeia bacterium]
MLANKLPETLPNEFYGKRYTPILTAAGVMLLFCILAYSTDAYKWFGATCMIAGILWCLLTGLVAALDSKSDLRPFTLPLCFALLVLWYLFCSQFWAPYMPLARRDLAGIYPAVGGFLGAFFWFSSAGKCTAKPLQVGAGILFSILVVLALTGYYQTYGTAGMPGSFAQKEAALIENQAYFHPAQFESLLHLIREGRTSGWIGASNIYAGFLVLAIPLGIGVIATQQRLVARLLAAGGVLVCIGGILLSGSRGGTVAALLFVALCFFAWPVQKRWLNKQKIAATVSLFVLAIPAVLQAQGTVLSRVGGLSTLQQRFYYWEAAWAMFLKSPLIGNGLGSFEVLYPAYRVVGSQETRQSHSLLFETLAELGLVGVLLFAAIFLWAVWVYVKSFKESVDPLSLFLLLSMLAGLFHGLVEYTFTFPEFNLFWGLILGLFVGNSLCTDCNKAPENAKAFGRISTIQISILSTLVACLLLLCWWRSNVIPGIIQEYELTSELAASEQEIGIALDYIDRAIYWEADNAQLYVNRARLASYLGADPRLDLIKAQQLNPYSAALVDAYADYQRANGNVKVTTTLLEKAHELHPLDATHRMNLADQYQALGRTEDAKMLFEGIWALKLSEEENRRLPGFSALLPPKLPE